MPAAPSRPAETRFVSRPANGAQRPSATWSRPSAPSSSNGRAMKASM